MMWKVWLIKFLYYIFFGFIFILAILIFLNIVGVDFYKGHVGDYIYRIIKNLNF